MFIVEDGTGLPNANSFVDVAFADSYFLVRNPQWANLCRSKKETFLVLATDYINLRYCYKYDKLKEDQSLQFPRTQIGFPFGVKTACCEYAMLQAISPLLVNNTLDESGYAITEKTETVGPITETVKYDTAINKGKAKIFRDYPTADTHLKLYIQRQLYRICR